MSKIFIGTLLVFLNFNIDLGASRIGLIPSFIGYILMLSGTAELTELSPRFQKVRPFLIFMVIYSAILYVLDIFGIGIVGVFLALPAVVISLYASYCIVMGIFDIESLQTRDLQAGKLYSVWKVQAVFIILTYLLFIFPVLAFIGMIVSFIVTIIYLFAFNNTKKLFYAQF